MEQNSKFSTKDSSEEIIDLKSPNIIVNNDNSSNSNEKKDSKNKKIGNNLILNIFGEKKVVGTLQSFILFIITLLGIILEYILFVITTKGFYNKILYIIDGMFCSLTAIFMTSCFLIEPGIIPRNHPDFQVEKEELTNKIKEEFKKEENKEIKLEIEKEIRDKKIHENNKLDEEKDKDDDILTNDLIPSILTQRKCNTCNIFRPPKASHCRHCDNCVINFDHHCFYVSNCIGFRNHKNFYLFLIYGTIYGIITTIFNIIHVLYVFFFSNFPIIYLMYKGNPYLLILASIAIFLCFLYISLGSRNYYFIGIPFLIGIIILFFLFIRYIHNVPRYINPYSTFVLLWALILTIFVTGTFIGQTKQILSGYTVKQSVSIKNEYVEHLIYRQKNISTKYLKEIPFNEKIKNFRNFFSIDRSESLVNN